MSSDREGGEACTSRPDHRGRAPRPPTALARPGRAGLRAAAGSFVPSGPAAARVQLRRLCRGSSVSWGPSGTSAQDGVELRLCRREPGSLPTGRRGRKGEETREGLRGKLGFSFACGIDGVGVGFPALPRGVSLAPGP